jgi:hypothetical protein
MGKGVEDLLKNISSRELTAWMAYYTCEPWGSEVEGQRHAVTSSTIANVGLGISNPKRLKSKPFKVKDFLVSGSKKEKSKGIDVERTRNMFLGIAKKTKKNKRMDKAKVLEAIKRCQNAK